MDPTSTFCPNLDCPARGQTGQGNIGIHSRKDQRFRCRQCRKTFAITQGTALYRLCTPAETVTLVVTLIAHGCPLQAIVVAFGFDERTVADWLIRAGRQSQAVHEHLVQTPRDLGQVQADEIRVKKQGGIVWMALAMMVSTRLWLAGEVSEHRDLPLIRRLIEQVRACALRRAILCCTDGLCTYIRALRETFRDAVRTGKGGRPRLRPWKRLLIAQVVKRYERRRVVEVERRIVQGSAAQVEQVRAASQGDGVINTAYIDRLNATFRERLSVADTPGPRVGAADGHAAARHVPDRHRLQLLHTACEPAIDKDGSRGGVCRADARDGRQDYRSWLECSGTAVVSRAAPSLDTAQAAWAPVTSFAAPG